MTSPTVIVTGADAKYFGWAQSCIRSIADNAGRHGKKFAFFDLGCTEQQLAWIGSKVDEIRQPDWDFEFPGRSETPSYLKGLLARPFLARYFPGHEVYIWIDADAWVHDWNAMECLRQAASASRGLAIVAEVDRCSFRQYGRLPDYWRQSYGWYERAFGEEMANRLCSFPMLNAGVFGAHIEAPHWTNWKERLDQALQRARTAMTDQLALNVSVYCDLRLTHTELLPMWCNWTTHNGLPKWSTESNCLVEPYMPRHKIGILHMTTRDKSHQRQLATTDGNSVTVDLTYPLQFPK
jgi:lipopolysaccharide biosynthesis glycosyltransferase